MSFTYSVTAWGFEASRASPFRTRWGREGVRTWGFEASRASTSSALRSDFRVFFVPNAAVESAPLRAALVMSARGGKRIEWGRGGRAGGEGLGLGGGGERVPGSFARGWGGSSAAAAGGWIECGGGGRAERECDEAATASERRFRPVAARDVVGGSAVGACGALTVPRAPPPLPRACAGTTEPRSSDDGPIARARVDRVRPEDVSTHTTDVLARGARAGRVGRRETCLGTRGGSS